MTEAMIRQESSRIGPRQAGGWTSQNTKQAAQLADADERLNG